MLLFAFWFDVKDRFVGVLVVEEAHSLAVRPV